MASLVDLVQPILAQVSGAPEQVAVEAYRRAAREFFSRALCWRELVEDETVADTSTYTLDPGTDMEIFDASLCELDDVRLTKLTYTQSRLRIGSLVTSGTAKYFRIALPNSLVLMPTPATAGAEISLLGMVRPTHDAEEIPDEIAFLYTYALESGALAWLMRQANQPWTDQKSSAMFYMLFMDEVDRNRSLGADGGMVGVPRTVKYGGL